MKLTKEKRLLMWTILLIAMVQMPSLALSPSINQINQVFFDGNNLSRVQTVMQLPNFISPFVTLLMAWLLGKNKFSKKFVIVFGLFLVAATGTLSFLLHSKFWHLAILTSLLGLGLSGFISTATSLLVDFFTNEERQMISGYQTSFINGGGILMSFCGGILATRVWYGGFTMLLVALPVAILGLIAIPGGKAEKTSAQAEEKKKSSRLPGDVFIYAGFIFFFMLTYSVLGSNLSTHIAQSGLGNSAVSGYVMATQMCGGVITGFFFGRLSKKLGDYTVAVAFTVIFIGMLILSLFPHSLVMTFIAMFISGSAMSLTLPQCLFSSSKYVDASNSALSASITSCVAPSFGGFFSAIIYTNLTTALFGESTVMRYRFVGFVSLGLAVIVAIVVTLHNKKGNNA